MRKRKWLIVAGLMVVALVGIGVAWAIATREPPKYPVRGTVMVADGKPAVGATVMFHPTGRKTEKVILGKADDKGEFVMTTDNPGDGVEAGAYTVTVVWTPPHRSPKKVIAQAMKDGKPPPGARARPPMFKKLFGNGPPDKAMIEKMLIYRSKLGVRPPKMSPDVLHQPKDKLEGRYSDPLESQIKFTVTAGENVVPPITLR